MATQTLPAFRFTTRFAFQHIANCDGTSDSICLRCHSAIASSHNESSLEQAESAHICTQADLRARAFPRPDPATGLIWDCVPPAIQKPAG